MTHFPSGNHVTPSFRAASPSEGEKGVAWALVKEAQALPWLHVALGNDLEGAAEALNHTWVVMMDGP